MSQGYRRRNGNGGGSVAAVSNSGLGMASGRWFTPMGSGSTGGTGANGRAIMLPVLFGKACTLNGISIDVTVIGDVAGVNRLGIYRDLDGMPDTLLADLGTTAADALGANALTISQAVSAVWYWLCLASQSQPTTRSTFRTPSAIPSVNRVSTATPGSTAQAVSYYFDTGYGGALPASAGAPTGGATLANTPAIWLKAS